MSEKVNESEQPQVESEAVDTSQLNADDAKAFEAHVKEATTPAEEVEDSATTETTEEQDSPEETSVEQPETSEDTEAKAEESEPESVEDTQAQEGLEQRFTKLEKSYKSLEAEFTRKSQRLKALEAENDKLRVSPTEKPMDKSEQIGDELFQSQVLEDLKKENPKAADLFESFGKELMQAVAKRQNKEIEEIKNNLTQTQIKENVNKFKQAYDEFLTSPLADLKDELDKVLDEHYPTDDLLLEAVRTNPNFFAKLKESVIASNFEKAAELVNKNKKASEQAEESARDKQIAKSKGVGKGNVSKPTVKDLMDLSEFGKLSNKDQEKLLKQKGLWKV